MKVSVALIAYNHEKFIAQAIDSVLMQETSFDYEIVIGEDRSTDHTRQIVIDYQKRFPNKVRALLAERNCGVQENFARTFKACSGQYLAVLEADDYWTSPHKLQMQADFLDAHPDCSICFHPIKRQYENGLDGDGAGPEYWPENVREFSTFDDLLREMFIPTCSVMLRNVLSGRLPEWMRSLKMVDWPLFLLHAQYGRIGCINSPLATYRIHSGGIWSTLHHTEMRLEWIKMYHAVEANLGREHARTIRSVVAEHYYKLATFYDQVEQHPAARKYAWKSLSGSLGAGRLPSWNQAKMAVRLSCPAAYSLAKQVVRKIAPQSVTH